MLLALNEKELLGSSSWSPELSLLSLELISELFSFFLALTYLKVTWQIISKLFVCDSYMRIGRGRSGAEPGWVFII